MSALLTEKKQISKECAHPLSMGQGRVFPRRLLLPAIRALSENLSRGLGKRFLQNHRSLLCSGPGTELTSVGMLHGDPSTGCVPMEKLPMGCV